MGLLTKIADRLSRWFLPFSKAVKRTMAPPQPAKGVVDFGLVPYYHHGTVRLNNSYYQ